MTKTSGNLMTKGEKTFNVINYTILSLLIIVTLYPMYFILIASISDPYKMMFHSGVMFLPKGFSLESYRRVLTYPMIQTGYFNTLFYVILGTSANVVLTAMAAYGLSRRNVMFKNILMVFITFTMFFDGGLIPTFLLVQNLDLIDKRMVLIVWKIVIPYNLIIMRTAFAGVPEELIESARIDGASHFKVFVKIAVPVSMSVMAVMILFYGVYHWNAWFYALIFLRKRVLYPLSIVLRELLIINDTGDLTADVGDMDDQEVVAATVKYATIIIATVPIMAVYPFLQKYFVKGVMIGAIKG